MVTGQGGCIGGNTRQELEMMQGEQGYSGEEEVDSTYYCPDHPSRIWSAPLKRVMNHLANIDQKNGLIKMWELASKRLDLMAQSALWLTESSVLFSLVLNILGCWAGQKIPNKQALHVTTQTGLVNLLKWGMILGGSCLMKVSAYILQDTKESEWKTATLGWTVFEIWCFIEEFVGQWTWKWEGSSCQSPDFHPSNTAW